MRINKILFFTLSNKGDVILTLPLLDILKENFPYAHITAMIGPRPKELLENSLNVNRLVVYDKYSNTREKIKLFNELRKENFDMIIDLRNSLFGAFLRAKYKTSPFLVIPKNIMHMKDRHIYRLHNAYQGYTRLSEASERSSLYISPSDERYINDILSQNGIIKTDRIIVVSPGARSHIKRWDKESFSKVCGFLIEKDKVKVILVGDNLDLPITEYIVAKINDGLVNLCGKTTMLQLAALLNRAEILVTNDSAVLHLGSYLNIPILAIFGPTNEAKYGPWSRNSSVVKKDIFCRPCEKAQCKFKTLECMGLIKTEDVLREARRLLALNYQPRTYKQKGDFKRILIVRTDKIGDVLLSTPVIKALRDSYPNAYIAMMIRPYAYDVIWGNPFLDKVILYDKYGIHKSWLGSIRFALELKRKRFDLAIVLHPTNRAHIITFCAGIPRRIGFNRKLGFLLSDRIRHLKHTGEKHEVEYNLDFVRYLGIEPEDKSLFMPVREDCERWIENLLKNQGVKEKDNLLAVNPGASCPSKIWPAERLAKVCDGLIEKYGFKVLVLAGVKDKKIAGNLIKNMQHPAIDLSAKTTISQLASLLKRCKLFISNDSGPVHIASAVGTPVISIFGRNQRGLSPLRWGPVGEKDKVVHKEIGCIECLAHNCLKEFACLKAITVEDVLSAADSILT